MLNPLSFIEALLSRGIHFYTGVPDSLLKAFCAAVAAVPAPARHVTAANEGAAVGLAAGSYLASGRPALVYMQNSGEGNAVNPLASLMAPEVYGIPVLLLVGWRGQPGVPDEPQHRKQGKITLPLLDVLDIPYAVLAKDDTTAARQVEVAVSHMLTSHSPFALVVEKGSFAPYPGAPEEQQALPLSREDAVKAIAASLGPKDVIVSTTGMASRELFECRAAAGEGHQRDFLCVGSMGHASQIALGISLEQPGRRVWCLDGDGACLMHMGSLATIAATAGPRFVHVLLQNGAHDSVGGQPTAASALDFAAVAKAIGYPSVLQADKLSSLQDILADLPEDGPVFLEVKVRKGHREGLGRPTTTPQQNLSDFMDFLRR